MNPKRKAEMVRTIGRGRRERAPRASTADSMVTRAVRPDRHSHRPRSGAS